MNTRDFINVPEHVIAQWEKWPEIWRQIDPKIKIDLNDHKISYWKPGYDWLVVMPKRDFISLKYSWELKCDVFGMTNQTEQLKDFKFMDIFPYRSVFCVAPNVECKTEHPYVSFEASHDRGIVGTTFTEYNVLDMAIYLQSGNHIDTFSGCICNGSISKSGEAIRAYWNEKPMVDQWGLSFSSIAFSLRQTI